MKTQPTKKRKEEQKTAVDRLLEWSRENSRKGEIVEVYSSSKIIIFNKRI